jgi:hypothetical protein
VANETVDLAFFDGKTFVLTAVDPSKNYGKLEYADDASAGIAFTLDGVTYAAVEDPSDGYRSCLAHVAVLPADESMATQVSPHNVAGRHVTSRKSYGDNMEICDTVELVDAITGRIVLAFGTDNADDYYPSFVAEWHPEALAANQ